MPRGDGAGIARVAGWAVNAGLRVALAAAAARVLLWPDKHAQFAKKGLRARLAAVAAATLLVPAAHTLAPRYDRYPVWTDNLYLSLFLVDAGGNALRLFSRERFFDVVPHFHGPGAITLVVGRTFDCSARRAFLIGQTLHVLLEIQEHVSDRIFDLHNVKGKADTARDMVAGLAGGAVYVIAWQQAGRP